MKKCNFIVICTRRGIRAYLAGGGPISTPQSCLSICIQSSLVFVIYNQYLLTDVIGNYNCSPFFLEQRCTPASVFFVFLIRLPARRQTSFGPSSRVCSYSATSIQFSHHSSVINRCYVFYTVVRGSISFVRQPRLKHPPYFKDNLRP